MGLFDFIFGERAHEQHWRADQASRNPADPQRSAGDSGGATPRPGTSAYHANALAGQNAHGAAALGALGQAGYGLCPVTSANTAVQSVIQTRPGGIITFHGVGGGSGGAGGSVTFLPSGGSGWAEAESQKEPLPRAAPAIGELIGHRAWRVQGGNLLTSVSSGSAWFPGKPMWDKVGHDQEIDDHNTAGIWAFKNPYDLAHEFNHVVADAGVFGTVWMWGTVIEHERGYRAQYAAIRSLDFAWAHINLEALRKIYLDPAINKSQMEM